MHPDSRLGTDADTALVEEPLVGAGSSVVHPRRLAFAQTAVSGGPGPTHNDRDDRDDRDDDNSLLSGATLRGGATAPSVPERIGRFRVLGPLGSGGMGVVVEAYDPQLDRKVAIKLLKGDRVRSDAQARLLREAQAMARLSHPNVVQVYDVGIVGEQVFVAMELIVGQTLGDWLEAQRRPWREVVRRFIAAARGLAAAHAVDLVHRDFKPDNVLLAEDGRVCVADFGLARGERNALPPDAGPSPAGPLALGTLTATGALMGTPFYMSPEQHRGEPVGPRSDIFSFAVALFEGLYGRRPFAGETMPALARNVLLGKSIDLPADHAVPSWLDAAVRRGFATRPEDRYANFDECIVALDRDPSRQRRRWLSAGGLTLSAALLGGAIQGQAAEEHCSAGAARSAQQWSDSTQAALRDRLATLPDQDRAAIEPRVIQGLSDYASAWIDVEHEACTGHRQGDRSDALFDRQQRCLDRRLAALGSAVETIRGGDEATLRAATMIIAKLPPIAYCQDSDALLAEVAPPEEPALRGRVDELRDQALAAEVLASAGQPEAALRSLAQLSEHALATEYRPLIAEVALAQARIAVDTHDGPRALAALDRAFLSATEVGADALATEAKARAIFVRGVLLGDGKVLEEERAHAEALSAHVGRRDLAALLANNSGAVLATIGELSAARELFRSALDLSRDDPLTRPIDYANGYLKNLAQLSDDPERREQLFAEVAERLDATLSPVHPAAIELGLTRAMLTTDPATAAQRLRETCPKVATPTASTLYLTCVECYHRLGHIEDELGDSEAAAAAVTAGLACLEGPITEDDREPVSSWRALLQGQLHFYRGEATLAQPALDEARRWMEPHRERWWVALLLADVDLTEGRRLALSDPTAAIPRLEAAIAGFEPLVGEAFDRLPSYGLARARTTLAQVLLQRPATTASTQPELSSEAERATLRRRSAALIDAAATYYRTAGPSYAPRLREVLAWRALHIDGEALGAATP